jgi:hypothetical protein
MLASAVAFTGCKGDQNAPQKQNEVVKTQFSIALPNQLSNGARRMPGTNVQKDGITHFQGMEAITLVPFAKQGEITSSDTRLGDNIVAASTPATAMTVTKADIENHLSKAKVFEDVTIPLTTGSFLFYAKSSASGDKFNTGALKVKNLANDKQPADFRFCLEQIVEDASPLLTTGAGKSLLDYMSSVANATDGTKAWKEYTVGENQALHDMFATFTSAHGLSSFEVARMMSDLYKSLIPAHSTIAEAIKTAIANSTYATVNTTTGVVTLQSGLLNFPKSYKLPEGSIDVAWNGTDAFIEGAYANMAKPNTFVYPAQLWYYVNSTIKTSNQSRKTMYDNTNDWDAILAKHSDALSVNARTRAVAIKDPIQYAVARLDVAIRLDAASLADNSIEVEKKATNVDCSGGFPVTAVLVGGQQDVKFDFTTTGNTDVTGISSYTIYDSVMDPATLKAEYKVAGSYSDINSTLVLENGTSNVMIAVEMLNDKADFYGAGNQLIPKDSKFYVVAELTASAATETDSHVFKQDYTTTAKLTLKNLKNAYNTIPDLRTPQLELGFSVDLSWENGHAYEIDFQ